MSVKGYDTNGDAKLQNFSDVLNIKGLNSVKIVYLCKLKLMKCP